ncbi:hypothetical protein T02_10026 [Trichinella nativa]|uniref:Uncharacterized protein n=4 Tax=Trichinella TaxID=6333 RepID=A0A0V1KVY2_9BILA|nr:hypothetical protein T05_10354 [Trichinella murrelli]KRY14597.1 hypothetical protein T12_2507 [Trichinella patagoniensis]KRY48374.1 hypothetical protein T03_10810 [Trichinella britovi]KRZ51233.1 hypothetical protein T02_10026 [Trichinella nativa]KRZ86486.1 hypothetical protein T08_758 [Trichinella sp. T8]
MAVRNGSKPQFGFLPGPEARQLLNRLIQIEDNVFYGSGSISRDNCSAALSIASTLEPWNT